MLLTFFTLFTATLASDCRQIAGNWYCDETTQVIYSGLGGVPGSYERVTNMDADSCTCSKAAQPFSGPLSPLDEDLSLHFRGPVQIAQFAAYTMTSSSASKRKRAAKPMRQAAAGNLVKRDQFIYTIIPPISTEYNLMGTLTDSSTVAINTMVTNTVGDAALSTTGVVIGLPSEITPLPTDIPSSTTPISTIPASPTTTTVQIPSAQALWSRSSYYNAAEGVADNIVFMNNMGGILSGTWSPCFGNSLSYASASGNYTAAAPETLDNVLIPSNTEVILFTSEPCTSATCGYVSPGVPAYKGFSGADKLFLFEFTMPSDPAALTSFNGDMPAIWALNGQIPRSQQYGACSCWQTGCGELDLFEVLSPGSDYLTTTFHSTLGGGGATSDYFARPLTGYMKAAVVFISATKEIQIIRLADDVTFDDTLAYSIYQNWQTGDISPVTLVD